MMPPYPNYQTFVNSLKSRQREFSYLVLLQYYPAISLYKQLSGFHKLTLEVFWVDLLPVRYWVFPSMNMEYLVLFLCLPVSFIIFFIKVVFPFSTSFSLFL